MRTLSMRIRNRDNLSAQPLFSYVLTFVLLLLCAVFSTQMAQARAQTNKFSHAHLSTALHITASPTASPSHPLYLTLSSREIAPKPDRLISPSRGCDWVGLCANRLRNSLRSSLLVADIPHPLDDFCLLTSSLPLLVRQPCLMTQANLCYHHSGRSPPHPF